MHQISRAAALQSALGMDRLISKGHQDAPLRSDDKRSICSLQGISHLLQDRMASSFLKRNEEKNMCCFATMCVGYLICFMLYFRFARKTVRHSREHTHMPFCSRDREPLDEQPAMLHKITLPNGMDSAGIMRS